MYKSSPLLLGICRSPHLVPSAHVQPLPNSEDSSEVEGFSSDDETDNAEVGEAAGVDGWEHSASPSEDTQAGHPRVLDRWRGSVVAPRKLPAIGK